MKQIFQVRKNGSITINLAEELAKEKIAEEKEAEQLKNSKTKF